MTHMQIQEEEGRGRKPPVVHTNLNPIKPPPFLHKKLANLQIDTVLQAGSGFFCRLSVSQLTVNVQVELELFFPLLPSFSISSYLFLPLSFCSSQALHSAARRHSCSLIFSN